MKPGGIGPRSAREHFECHSPGQAPNLRALIDWQSRRSGRPRFVGSQFPLRVQQAPATAVPPGAWTLGEPRGFSSMALAWRRPGPACAELELGSLQLWALLPESVEWLDVSLSLHLRGSWFRLDAELDDEPTALAEDDRLQVVLRQQELAALAPLGVTLEQLRAGIEQPEAAHWALRLDGLGAFVAGLIDLGWPAPEIAR